MILTKPKDLVEYMKNYKYTIVTPLLNELWFQGGYDSKEEAGHKATAVDGIVILTEQLTKSSTSNKDTQ